VLLYTQVSLHLFSTLAVQISAPAQPLSSVGTGDADLAMFARFELSASLCPYQ